MPENETPSLHPDKSLRLQVLTPATQLLPPIDVAWVQAWLIDGSIGIWPGHAPLLAETAAGPLRFAICDENGEEAQLDLAAGLLQITGDAVTLFTSGKIAEAAPPTQDSPGDDLPYARLTLALLSSEEFRG